MKAQHDNTNELCYSYLPVCNLPADCHTLSFPVVHPTPLRPTHLHHTDLPERLAQIPHTALEVLAIEAMCAYEGQVGGARVARGGGLVGGAEQPQQEGRLQAKRKTNHKE